jgi:hypothetical protein
MFHSQFDLLEFLDKAIVNFTQHEAPVMRRRNSAEDEMRSLRKTSMTNIYAGAAGGTGAAAAGANSAKAPNDIMMRARGPIASVDVDAKEMATKPERQVIASGTIVLHRTLLCCALNSLHIKQV